MCQTKVVRNEQKRVFVWTVSQVAMLVRVSKVPGTTYSNSTDAGCQSDEEAQSTATCWRDGNVCEAADGRPALPGCGDPGVEAENWRHRQPSCTTWVLTVGGGEGRRCPILCVQITGDRGQHAACETPASSLKPRVSFLETGVLWTLRRGSCLGVAGCAQQALTPTLPRTPQACSQVYSPSTTTCRYCLSSGQMEWGFCHCSLFTFCLACLFLWHWYYWRLDSPTLKLSC